MKYNILPNIYKSLFNFFFLQLGQLLQVVGELEGLLQCLQGGSLRQHQGCSSCGWGVEVKQGLEVQIHRSQEQVIFPSLSLYIRC